MNKKFIVDSDLINKTKGYIQSIFPKTTVIDVKIERLPTKEFRTKVIVNLPERQLIAKKKASTYHHSLEKAQSAIIKQGQKDKKKWKKRSRPNLNTLNLAA